VLKKNIKLYNNEDIIFNNEITTLNITTMVSLVSHQSKHYYEDWNLVTHKKRQKKISTYNKANYYLTLDCKVKNNNFLKKKNSVTTEINET
jgi:hypothetical protein